MLLTWDDRSAYVLTGTQVEEHLQGEGYRLAERLEVAADGTGIVSHAGLALLRALADRAALTGGLSKALASDRLVVHDRAG